MNHSRLSISKTYLLPFNVLLIVLSPGLAAAQSPRAAEAHKLRTRIDSLLRAELTEHWYPRAFDQELGGFHQTFARDWSPLPDENRFLVYQARLTWTAAAFGAYSEANREEYAKYALRGIDYLDQTMRDREQGGFHFVLDARGKVDPRLGTDKHVYGTAFVLYAGSQAFAFTHNERALRVARDAFDWLETHAHDSKRGGYFEALKRDGNPILRWEENAPISRRTDRLGVYFGFKSMNSHIHLLEALAAFYHVEATPVVKSRLEETLAVVRDRVAVEPGALNLYFTQDWRALPAHDSFGHDVETAYLLVEAAEALGIPEDPKTWQVARQLVDHALDFGWDETHGGFYDKGDVFAGSAYDTTKVWWTQAEGLNALLFMHKKYGDQSERYWKAFLKQWDFIEQHMIDPANNGWFAETTREGTLIGDGRKASQWKANYHTGRAMMNVARMLGEMEGVAGPGGAR
jgi:mannobiose 2-epimerase